MDIMRVIVIFKNILLSYKILFLGRILEKIVIYNMLKKVKKYMLNIYLIIEQDNI